MEGGGGVASVASLTMDCEDMFKEITKKLYGDDAAMGVAVGVNVSGAAGATGTAGAEGVEYPQADRELVDDLRPEEHITAWGLAALMQNGFPPPGILQVFYFADPFVRRSCSHLILIVFNPGQFYPAHGPVGRGPMDGGGGTAGVGALARRRLQPSAATVQVHRLRVCGVPGARRRALAGHALAGASLPVPAGRLRLRERVGARCAPAPRARPPFRPGGRRPLAARQPRAR